MPWPSPRATPRIALFPALALISVRAMAQPTPARGGDNSGAEAIVEERSAGATEVGGNPGPWSAVASAELSTAIGPESPSRSVGTTSGGRLRGAARLTASPTLRFKNEQTRFGTLELVRLVEWSAEQVERAHPGAQLNVGDLSRERGGRLRPHRSHRAGRDADLGFYLRTSEGAPIGAAHFVNIGRDQRGHLRDGTEVHFDLARNWALVAALLGQDRVPVQYVMVVERLKRALIDYGRAHGAAPELLARAEEALGPRSAGGRGDSHYSHFHVRIYCAIDDREVCRDQQPLWSWLGDDFTHPEGAEPLRFHVRSAAERRRVERDRQRRQRRVRQRRAQAQRRARARARRRRSDSRRARSQMSAATTSE